MPISIEVSQPSNLSNLKKIIERKVKPKKVGPRGDQKLPLYNPVGKGWKGWEG